MGKTTVAVNLALALNAMGNSVGLLDADVYGPNVPRMMGVNEPPRANGERIRPIEKHGLKLMSMGFLNPGDKPVIWRGPMLHSVMNQFINNVEWGTLDYLIVDLPPGTGDVALSLAQSTAITGAIVVTTPSEVALEDARKAVMMFRQLKVELLGMVENMSYLIAPRSGERIDVFGEGGGRNTAAQMQIPLLGEIPIAPEVRAGGDAGKPVALLGKEAPSAAPFLNWRGRSSSARWRQRPTPGRLSPSKTDAASFGLPRILGVEGTQRRRRNAEFPDGVTVHIESQAGALRDIDIAVANGEQRLAVQHLERRAPLLLGQERRGYDGQFLPGNADCGARLKPTRDAQAHGAVHDDRPVEGFGERGDLPGHRQTAAKDGIRLQDVV